MLFANGEDFWKSPSIYDVIGLAGFALGIASIWLSWWLAKRDIEKRLDEAADRASKAAREEVRRVAQALLYTSVSETMLSISLAREACRSKAWVRSGELCEVARQQLAGVLEQPAIGDEIQAELRNVAAVLLDCVTEFRRKREPGTGKVSDAVLYGLDDSVLVLRRVEGKLKAIRQETGHE